MSERKTHDIAIIGSGPGGYVAAIKAAQMGQSVALIDHSYLGGCCLNVGCIPTKTLLSNASVLQTIRHAKDFGISVGPVSFDYAQMKAQKDKIVAKIRASLEGLIKTNKITIYRGKAQFQSPGELKIIGQDNLFVSAGKIIIATGSVPLDIKAFPCDHHRILNSTSILEITELPRHLCIVGGGYIGCEFASLFNELGVHVTILEALPTILAGQGKQIAEFMTKAFHARGIDIQTNVAVQRIDNQKSHAAIALVNGKTMDADIVLIAVGRKIYTDGLALDRAGLAVNEKGAIETNSRMETAVKDIYAIGDVTGQWMLAHVASHQGLVAASNASGHEMHIDYAAVPAVVFTSPEIATVGLNLEQAIQAGHTAAAGFFPFQALGKAQASMETEGFAQIVADRKTGQILGAQIIGRDASNLIAEMALAIQNELTLESVMQTIHAHPTIAESWLEAAAIANETPIHFPPRTKR
ncbi:MAG: lpdA [Parachlamydiales bacterium]|nr:lpdA [Parachlamydiales bacterium]